MTGGNVPIEPAAGRSQQTQMALQETWKQMETKRDLSLLGLNNSLLIHLF